MDIWSPELIDYLFLRLSRSHVMKKPNIAHMVRASEIRGEFHILFLYVLASDLIYFPKRLLGA